MHQVGEAPPEELDRLSLQLELPTLVYLKDRPGAGAKGAVVEKDDTRPQEKELSHAGLWAVGRHRDHGLFHGCFGNRIHSTLREIIPQPLVLG
jgi:hypothetical protein